MPADKKTLRAQLLALRAKLPAAHKAKLDRAVTARVLQSAAYQAAETLFLYVATAQEIDTRDILLDALACGKTVCVPLCGARGEMTARRISAWNELRPGAYGILEPVQTAQIIAPEQITFAVVPALACDPAGHRIGYGGGYYDRYLPRTHAVCAALCTEARLLDDLPYEPHDFCCQLVITERRVLRTDEKK